MIIKNSYETYNDSINEYNIDSFLYESILTINESFYQERENLIKLEHNYLVGKSNELIFNEGVIDFISSIWEKIKSFFKKIYEWIKEKIKQFVEFIKRIFFRKGKGSPSEDTTVIYYMDINNLLAKSRAMIRNINNLSNNLMNQLKSVIIAVENSNDIESLFNGIEKNIEDINSKWNFISDVDGFKQNFGLLEKGNNEKRKIDEKYQRLLNKDAKIIDKLENRIKAIKNDLTDLQNSFNQNIIIISKGENEIKKLLTKISDSEKEADAKKFSSKLSQTLSKIVKLFQKSVLVVNHIIFCIQDKVAQVNKYGNANPTSTNNQQNKSEAFEFDLI